MTTEAEREKKREYARQYRAANRDKVRAGAARYYAKNREVILERQRLAYLADPEPKRQRTRDAYRADPAKARERHRKTGERHGDKWAARRRQKRAEGWLPASDARRLEIIAQLLEAQDGRCYLCEEPLSVVDANLEHDHRCCPKQKSFCRYCIRGAACAHCNTAIAMLRDDPDLLERVARNLRAKLAETTPRIAAKPGQGVLDLG